MRDRSRQWKAVASLCMAALVWWAPCPAGAADPDPQVVEDTNSLTVSLQIPHTKWAKPYAGGRTRVLFLVPLNTNVNVGPTRVAVEIAQRYDIEADAVLVSEAEGSTYAVTYPGGSGVFGGQVGEKRLARLLAKPYDCYVVTAQIMGFVPDSARATIMEHVKKGAGLALLYQADEKDKPLLGDATALDSVPEMLGGLEQARAYDIGEGRAVSYSAPGWSVLIRTPKSLFEQGMIFGVDLPRDLRTEKQGRAILWAAGREPALRLSLSVGGDAFDRGELSRHDLQVRWEAPGGDLAEPMRVETRVRCQNRATRTLPVSEGLTAGSGKLGFSLPPLPAGQYFVDAIARSNRGVEAWAVKEFTVTTDEQLGPVTLDSEWGEAGESIKGSVEVNTPHRQERTLLVQAIDRYGRAIVRRKFPKPAATVAFSLPTAPWMPGYVAVEAVLIEGDKEVCSAYSGGAYTIPHRKQDDWHFVMWGRLYNSQDADIAEETLARSGITSRIETSHIPHWYMTRAAMNYVPYCSSGLQRQHWKQGERQDSISLDDNGVLSGGCWNDEPAVTERLDKWLGDENDYRRQGVLVYSMGNENETLASCMHPACIKTYQEFLQRQYRSIGALNASWGTSFESFDKVGLSKPNDNYEKTALEEKNYPRWFDRKAFQSWNFANYCKKFGDAARRIDPQAISGPEGTGSLDDDLGLIVRNTNWTILYSMPAAEVVRSVAPRGYLYGHWIGFTTSNGKYPLSDFWLSFLRGGNSIGWWRIDNHLAPNYGLSTMSGSREVAETGRVVFDGLGKLLNVESGMQHDGVAMLHSFASAQAASHLGPGPTYGTYAGWLTNSESEGDKGLDWALAPKGKSHFVWHRAIRATGLQFEYVTDRMMRRGEFEPDEYKVLVLSQCEAIGATEAQVIRKFAADGGTVIADVRPGLYDDHCKPLEVGALDDLFGVRHTANVEAVTVTGKIAGAIADAEFSVELSELDVNPALELTTAKALGRAGETPICIVNKVGKGQAILLNFTICTFPNLSLPETDEADADFLKAVFASAAVEWPLHLLNEKGDRKRNVEVVRWKTGDDIEVLAVYGPLNDGRGQWRPTEGLLDRIHAIDVPKPVTIALPQARHVTVIGLDRPVGLTRQFTIQTRPWRPVFVVLSKNELKAPQLTAAPRVVARGEKLRLQIAVPDAQGMHALKFRTTAPDGQEASWFSRSLIVKDGTARTSLAIAHNEQIGQWKVTATDLYTNKTAEALFNVQ